DAPALPVHTVPLSMSAYGKRRRRRLAAASMKLSSLFLYFITGGLFTTIIVTLEENGQRTLSGLATLVPVFTLVAYLFIGQTAGANAVSQHAKWVLAGTLVSWVPYMLAIVYLAPKVGAHKAIIASLAIFFIMALAYIEIVNRFKLFQ
ncbi:MAG: hypothetical protein ACLPWG_05550, partial [Steroidobacteraceae bacterium]